MMPTLHPGDHNDCVANLKLDLKNQLGITFRPPVDVYDSETVVVVKRWQALQGLPATGVVDGATWASLI
jgi:murein L,D-transpeptidase YcbB/YkuD